MLKVFADAGLPASRVLIDGVYEVRFPLPADETDAALGTYRDAVAERERSADVASLRHVLTPGSVAVIGASPRPGSPGRAILRNIITAGFPGAVYAVNPDLDELDGVPCVPSPAALPQPVDLAIIAAPAAAVLAIAQECGRRGAEALVVITSGLGGPARAELLGTCRRHGMRLVGPASFGVITPSIGLDASFASRHPRPGRGGLALQASGGVGFVLLEHLSRLGVGISSAVSLGDKDDVSGTDMLLWWESDKTTKLAVLYLESIANPRKFARAARAVARAMPILMVNAGRATARATAASSPLLTRQVLFEQAGVIAAANLGELLDTVALLASQPVPTGARVAVVSNTRGGTMLAADACTDAGLEVANLAEATQRALRDILPPGATMAGPVDTTATHLLSGSSSPCNQYTARAGCAGRAGGPASPGPYATREVSSSPGGPGKCPGLRRSLVGLTRSSHHQRRLTARSPVGTKCPGARANGRHSGNGDPAAPRPRRLGCGDARSVSVIRRYGMGRVLLAAGGEHMRTDLLDGVVQMLESFGDPLPRQVVG
jgi:succinyl-CoA synthetase alpha subunit